MAGGEGGVAGGGGEAEGVDGDSQKRTIYCKSRLKHLFKNFFLTIKEPPQSGASNFRLVGSG